MTQPVSAGYPDWGRYAARSTKVYRDATVSVATSLTSESRLYVGDIPYLKIITSEVGSTDNVLVRFQFFDAETSGTVMGQYAVVLGASDSFNRTIPVQGPWLEVEYISDTTSTSLRLIVAGSWIPSISVDAFSSNSILFSESVSVATSSTDDTDAGRVWPGAATVTVQALSGPAVLVLRAMNLDGTFTDFLRLGTPGTRDESRHTWTFLPPNPIRMSLVNRHTASQIIRGYVTVRPFETGA